MLEARRLVELPDNDFSYSSFLDRPSAVRRDQRLRRQTSRGEHEDRRHVRAVPADRTHAGGRPEQRLGRRIRRAREPLTTRPSATLAGPRRAPLLGLLAGGRAGWRSRARRCAATSFTSTLTQPATAASARRLRRRRRSTRSIPSSHRSTARTASGPTAASTGVARTSSKADFHDEIRGTCLARPRADARGLRLEMDKCWPYPTRKRLSQSPTRDTVVPMLTARRILAVSLAVAGAAITAAPALAAPTTVTVAGTAEGFQPSGITVSPGHPVQLTATGNIDYGCNNFNGCAGDPDRDRPERRGLPCVRPGLPCARPARVQPGGQGRRRCADSARQGPDRRAGQRPAVARLQRQRLVRQHRQLHGHAHPDGHRPERRRRRQRAGDALAHARHGRRPSAPSHPVSPATTSPRPRRTSSPAPATPR